MKKPAVTDIHVDDDHGRSVHWTGADGCRYHYWCAPDDDVLTPRGDTFYKNPARGIDIGDPGDFRTRHLKISKNTDLIGHVRGFALEHGLIAVAREQAEAREQRRLAEAQASYTKDVLDMVRGFAKTLDEPLDGMSDDDLLAGLRRVFAAASASRRPVGDGGSVECPYCHWGFAPSVIDQHMREKH
jgi:hypothetical protein